MINSFSNDREVASGRAISAKAIVPVIILILPEGCSFGHQDALLRSGSRNHRRFSIALPVNLDVGETDYSCAVIIPYMRIWNLGGNGTSVSSVSANKTLLAASLMCGN